MTIYFRFAAFIFALIGLLIGVPWLVSMHNNLAVMFGFVLLALAIPFLWWLAVPVTKFINEKFKETFNA